jgi:hypothetical protein
MTEDMTVHIARLDPAPGAIGLYVMHSRNPVRPETAAHFRRAWQAAWESAGRQAPGLMILDGSLSIEALADGDLKELGLMRIPGDGAL